MSLAITKRIVGSVVVLDCKGRITGRFNQHGMMLSDCGTAEFKRCVSDCVEKQELKLILNFTDVTYVDSSGIGELVTAFTLVTNSGGQLFILGLNERVKDLLQITKLYTVFTIFDDEVTAIRSFA